MKKRLLFTWWAALVTLLFTGQFLGLSQPHGSAAAAVQTVPAATVRFIAIGDMGTGDKDQFALARQMVVWQDTHLFDTILMLGDNIYPDGNPALIPAKFEKPYAELLRRGIRFQASLGNHDVVRGRTAQIQYPNFNMGGRAYYSFVKGATAEGKSLAEFFALDSTAMDGAQLKWLEGALAASNAEWKLAFFHHPLYSSAITHGSSTALRAKLEPLFVRYGVSVVFSGHDHTYERTKPLQGIQYFVAGAASGKLRRGDINRKSPFFNTGNDQTGSFLYVEITRAQLTYQAVDVSGKVFDEGNLLPKTLALQPALIHTPVTFPEALPKTNAGNVRAGKAKPETPAATTAKVEKAATEIPKHENASKESNIAASANSGKTLLSDEQARALALQQFSGQVESSKLKRKDKLVYYTVKIRNGKEAAEVRINADNGSVIAVKHK